jgi:hypothetical protein
MPEGFGYEVDFLRKMPVSRAFCEEAVDGVV